MMYQKKQHSISLVFLMAYIAAAAITLCGGTAAADPAPWRFFGADVSNTGANIPEYPNINGSTQINPRTTPSLTLKWSISTIGDISTTPTVEAGGLLGL